MKKKVLIFLAIFFIFQISYVLNFQKPDLTKFNSYYYNNQAILKKNSQPDILFVYTDGTYDYSSSITDALNNLGVAYDLLKSPPDYNTLKNYKIVIWSTGLIDSNCPSYEVRLEQYLDNGGNLLLSSNCWILVTASNTTFINDYLGVNNNNTPSFIHTYRNIIGNGSDPIGQGLSFDQTSFSFLAQWMQPKNYASIVFYDSDNASDLINATAISRINSAKGYKAAFFCMPLEFCGSLSLRSTILNRTFQWFIPNDNAPTLTDGQVIPSSGNTNQLFTFKVNYTDKDNNSPTFLEVILNNTFIYDMQKEDPSDNNYTNGVLYNYSTYLSAGSYNYTFNSSDWYFNVNSSTYLGPDVSYINLNPPNLDNGQVYPMAGTEITNFKFSVNYSDADNNNPTYINVTIDSQIFGMSKENPLDINFIDGVIYLYYKNLTIGNHFFYFNASDGITEIGLPTEGNYSGPIVSAYFPASSILFDGLSYNWTGTFLGGILASSGIEYYQYLGGNSYQCNETITIQVLGQSNYSRTVDNRSRNITSTSMGCPWAANTPDLLWIFNNVSLGDRVNISIYQGPPSYKEFNVSGETTRSALGLTFDVWILNHPDGDIAYYDKVSGLLIEGTFDPTGNNYFIKVTETNGIFSPIFNIVSPMNQTYYFRDVPVIALNSTKITNIWFRNSTDGISWSDNQTMTYNGTHFINSSNLNWTDGSHIIQIFGNSSIGIITQKSVNFTVDTYGPYIVLESPKNNTYLHRNIDVILSNYSQVDEAWLRYNSGGGWSANFSIEYNGSHFVNNSIIWPDGNYYLQVFANDSTTEIALREEWFVIAATSPLNISHNLADDERPRIILDSGGNIHIVWYGNETNTYQIYYDNNKNGYLGNKQQISNNVADQIWIDIAIDSSNIVHLVWIDMGTFDIYYTNNTGGLFNVPVIIPGGPINLFPAIDVDTSGLVNIVWWSTNGSVWALGCINNSAGSFGTPISITPNLIVSNVIPPAIAIDNSDIVHVVYGYGNSTHTQLTYENNSLGDFSTSGINFSRYNAFNNYPDLAIDSLGKVHITWSCNITGDNEIYYINNTLNDFTSEPLNVSKDFASNDDYSTISLDTLSVPNSVFIIWSKNTSEIYESNNFFGSFNVPRNISNSYTADFGPDITIDSNEGLAYFVWQGNGSDFDIFYDSYGYHPLTLLSPANITYDYQEIAITIQNNSFIDKVWCRNNTGGGWSENYTLTWNGTLFINGSLLIWDDGNYRMQIFGNDSVNSIFMKEIYFQVDITPPSGAQDPNTANPQKNDFLGHIWVNGTASDLLSGIATIVVQSNNVTGGASWSVNQGNLTDWVFFNNSYIPDTNAGEVYEIIINVTDNAENWNLIYCYIFIDNTPPSGSQDILTQQPQKNDNQGHIWVNGTGSDLGSGIAAVVVQSNNVTGGASWSVNQGTETSWASFNTSYIPNNNAGEVYEIILNVTDNAGNWNLIYCYIFIDNTPPLGSQYILTQQPQKNDNQGHIWVNGTAFDLGSGIAVVIVQSSNVTGGPSWSVNQGNLTNWAFFNNSYISDSNAGEVYEIIINVTDNAGNSNLIYCYIIVDNTPPSGSQDFLTQLPQKNDNQGHIWVNGTASDLGTGIAAVIVQSSNVTGGPSWSVNQGTGTSWVFYNTSFIPDNSAGEYYEIVVNITDNIGNWNIILCSIFIDNTPPEILNQDPVTYYTTFQTGLNIWINGTALDYGSGLQSITVVNSNASCSWTLNLNTNQSWAFKNATPIMADGIYEIRINASDTVGNINSSLFYIRVDLGPPTGAAGVYLSIPQNGTLMGPDLYIWLNGTAVDLGSGLLNVSIYLNEGNTSALWSINQNTNENWAFRNMTQIQDNNYGERYEIKLNISDIVGYYCNLSIYFRVDTTKPLKATNLTDIGTLLSDNMVQLNWTDSMDNSRVKYEIWRISGSGIWQLINTTDFDVYQFNDTGIADGSYEYRIRPIDEAGNYGEFSDSISVKIETTTQFPPIVPLPTQDNLIIWILILIGTTLGLIAIIIVSKRRKARRTPISIKPVGKKQIIPLYEALTTKTKEAPQPSSIEEKIPPPVVPEEEKEKAAIRITPGEKVAFYYQCPTCKQVYTVPEAGDYKCLQCQTLLKFQEKIPVTKPSPSIQSEPTPKEFIYYCKNCKQFFKVPLKGHYNCVYCSNVLEEHNP